MAETIVNSLHSLITHSKLDKVFKALKVFIDDYDGQIKDNIANILAIYQPSNNLEKLIRVRLIDHYRCYDEVLNILTSEDPFYITRALQCSWFFENSNFDPQYLVYCVIPNMSYSTRFKVLRRYSKLLHNPDVAVTFFNLIKERYGLRTALILLPACDEVFVKNTLEAISIQVPVSVLLILFDIYPSVVVSYLTHLLGNVSRKKRVFRTFEFYNYKKLFLLVATKEPGKFAILMEKYNHIIPYMKLSRRSAKQFVHVAFDSIKKNVNIYFRIFNWKYLGSCLSERQISELQFALFPKTVNEFFEVYRNNSLFVVTSFLKEQKRREILVSNFNKAYNKPINDYLDVMDLSSVTMIFPETKENWVESKLPEIDSPEEKIRFIVHLPCKKSLPMLKKMVYEQAEVNIRSDIVNAMFDTVMINNEEELITDICQYVVKRFRNDKTIIKENVVSKLAQFKRLIEIIDDCWESIEEIINIMILNDELGYSRGHVIVIISTHIHYRLKHNLPIDANIEKLLKISGEDYSFNLCESTQYEKKCLKWFVDNFQKCFLNKVKRETNDNENSSTSPDRLFIRLCSWNGSHKNDRIDVPDWLKQLIEKRFKTKGYDFIKQSILDVLKKDELIKHSMYNTIFPDFINCSVLIYKLHQDPELVKNHAADILKRIRNDSTKLYHSFFQHAKLYPASNLPDVITSHCLKILKEKGDNSEETNLYAKNYSIRVLSLMLPTNKFVDIIAEFYPRQSVIDDYSVEGKELFKIQRAISACFKYVDSPSEILESLNKFAVGDYLRLVVGSLNSVCLHISENQILQLLKQRLDCPVSLRKHFFRAYFMIAPISSTLEMLVGSFENEKNISLRLLLFENALRFFVNEPSTETFCVLKDVIEKAQPSDHGVINKLLNFEMVPNEFISQYLKLLWDTLSLNEAALESNRSCVIDCIKPDVLCSLSDDFCDVLIAEVFERNSIDIILFSARYLLYSGSLEQLNSRIEKVMSGMKQHLNRWNDFNLTANIVFKSRNILSNFVESLVHESFNVSDEALPPYDLIVKIKTDLLKSLQENDILEEILLLEVSGFVLVTPDNSEFMYNFSKFLVPIVDRMVTSYSNASIDLISSTVEKVLVWKFSQKGDQTQENNIIELSEILLKSNSNNFFVLGLKLLPSVIRYDTDRYKELLDFMFLNTEPNLKPFVNKLFKELRSVVRVG